MTWWRGLSKRRRGIVMRRTVYLVALLVLAGVALLIDWDRVVDAFFQPDLIREQFPEIITQAAKNTLIFTFFGFSGGLVIGLVLALLKISTLRPFRWAATLYVEVVRGIPLLLWIIIIGLGLPIALDLSIPGTYGAGSTALAAVAGAYMAETIRAGIEAVPRGQVEAARSLGMTSAQAMSWIVLPQAFRIILPPLTNEFVLLLKDTSLVSVLGVTAATKELTRFGRDGVISNANATPLVVAGLVYLALTVPLTRLAAAMERRGAKGR